MYEESTLASNKARQVPRSEVLFMFEQTRSTHGGVITPAARAMNMKPETLSRALHRARKDGYNVVFTTKFSRARYEAQPVVTIE